MADISIQCPACDNQFHVSEYVDLEKLVCAKCGAEIAPPPKAKDEEKGVQKLRLATAKPADPMAQTPNAETSITQALMQRCQQKSKHASKRHRISILTCLNDSLWFNWVIFVILAGVGIYFRFFNPPMVAGLQTELRYWGSIALLFCHFMIVLSAFSDDAFQGVLCLLIPGYSLYYLFSVSDKLVLRAITAALVIAFGLDAWQYVSAYSIDVFDSVNRWMKAGGDTSNSRVYGH